VPEYSLFNSADDCLAYSLDERAFDESLLLNVLFQDRILLNEAYFFNSTLLADHVKRAVGHPSLFEVASREGLIVPAFRDPSTEPLDQAYALMRHEYGPEYALLHPQMQPYRDRVVASIDVGLEKEHAFFWPSGKGQSGDGYRDLVREMLQTDQPPAYVQDDPNRAQLFERVWEVSKPWRFEHVEAAVAQTRAKGAQGLQRTELFCSLGWSLGMPKKIVTISPPDIIQRCSDPEQRLAMEIFLKWVTQCHHLNQSRYFEASINFPVYNIDQDFLMDSLLRSPLDRAPSSDEGFRCEVELPPLDVLMAVDASDLVKIRADLGLGYLLALRRWQDDPSLDNQEAAKSSLGNYCSRICTRYDTDVRQPLVAAIMQGRASPEVELGKAVMSAAGAAFPHFGVFSQVAQPMTTVYRYVRAKKTDASLKPRSRQLEVTLAETGL